MVYVGDTMSTLAIKSLTLFTTPPRNDIKIRPELQFENI